MPYLRESDLLYYVKDVNCVIKLLILDLRY